MYTPSQQQRSAATPRRVSLRALINLVATLGLLALTAGCAIKAQYVDRFVLVHKDGYAIDPHRERLVPTTDGDRALEIFKQKWGDTILRGIDARAARLPPNTPLRLLLFVHGGLNTYDGGIERIGEMVTAIQSGHDEDRVLSALPKYYPLFINWNSDLFESIYDDMFEMRFGERRPAAGYATALPAALVRVGQGISNLPASVGLEIGGAYNGLDVRVDDDEWPHCRTKPLGTPSNSWQVRNAFVFALFYPTRVLTSAAIQGLGAPAWDTMKRRAELVMAPRKQVTKFDPKEVGGGRLLIEALSERIIENGTSWTWTDERTKQGRQVPLEITVVGHSMGTMVLNHLLETFPGLRIHRIVYLAAADSIHHVYGTVAPYLHRYKDAEFWSFSLAETNEALEVDFIDVIPRGSLLVWIDHFFQRINAPSDRTFGRASNLRAHVEVPPGLGATPTQKQRFFLVKFGRTEKDPARHGDLGKVRYLDMALETVEEGQCRR